MPISRFTNASPDANGIIWFPTVAVAAAVQTYTWTNLSLDNDSRWVLDVMVVGGGSGAADLVLTMNGNALTYSCVYSNGSTSTASTFASLGVVRTGQLTLLKVDIAGKTTSPKIVLGLAANTASGVGNNIETIRQVSASWGDMTHDVTSLTIDGGFAGALGVGSILKLGRIPQ